MGNGHSTPSRWMRPGAARRKIWDTMGARWWMILMIALSPAIAVADAPVGVSPGHPVETSTAPNHCPTFHWSAVDEAIGYELVVYRIDGGSAEPSVALRKSVPEGVTGWTPPKDDCLERGQRYAWSVRARVRMGEAQWSAPYLFRVAAGPSRSDLEEALAVVKSYLAGEAERERAAAPPGVAPPSAAGGVEAENPAAEPVAGKSVELTAPLHSPAPGQAAAGAVLSPGALGLVVEDDFELGGLLLKEGDPFLHNVGGNGLANTGLGVNALAGPDPVCCNTAVGHDALRSNDGGFSNVALGVSALVSNTSGFENTATGAFSLQSNTTGQDNTALGLSALNKNKSGNENTAVGSGALEDNRLGSRNVAVGFEALGSLGSGDALAGFGNIAMGKGALGTLESGSRNIGLGLSSGSGLTSGSDNIYLLSLATSGESNTLRIGQGTGAGTALLNRAFISGIRGVQTAKADAQVVLIDSQGQLGTINSSRRFKEAIRDMGEASAGLLDLRPVTFRYRQPFEGGEKPIQFGLIAEEVAEVFPELVIYDELGRPQTVKYHLLSSLLLGELQKLEALASRQGVDLAALEERLRAMENRRTRRGR